MPHSFIFLDESGLTDRQNQPVLAMGAYRIADTSALSQELYRKHYNLHRGHAIRRREIFKDLEEKRRVLSKEELSRFLKSTTHHEFHFLDVDRFNLKYYLDLVDTVFQHPFYFSCLLLDKSKYTNQSGAFNNAWEAYLSYSKKLISANLVNSEQVCVIADFASKPSSSNEYEFLEAVLRQVKGVENVLCADSESFILLQVSDILLGAVVFMMKQALGYTTGSKNEKAKSELTNYIFAKLDIGQTLRRHAYKFDTDILVKRPNFYFQILCV